MDDHDQQEKKTEILNELIRKSKNIVVLAGAGTSKSAGFPLGSELFANLKLSTGIFEGISVPNDFKPRDDQTIETYLGFIETAIKYHKESNNSNFELEEFMKKVKNKIAETMSSPTEDLKAHKDFLSKMLASRQDVNKGDRIKIFTTNYDTLFEEAASQIQCVVIDGFSYSGKERLFSPISFDYDIIDNRLSKKTNSTIRVDNLIYLHKLHGSINWKRDEKGNIFSHYKTIEEPLLIIPGDGKFQESYDSPYIEMITRLKDALLDSSLLIIVGYSFQDKHINSIIKEAFQRNSQLQLKVCWNTDSKDIVIIDYREGKVAEGALKQFWDAFQNRMSVIEGNNIFAEFSANVLKYETPSDKIEKEYADGNK